MMMTCLHYYYYLSTSIQWRAIQLSSYISPALDRNDGKEIGWGDPKIEQNYSLFLIPM